MRESCSSGSVGGEGGNRLAYPAYTVRDANVAEGSQPMTRSCHRKRSPSAAWHLFAQTFCD
jgi:hypothetical protein